ncbi:MAG: hypothetical protein ACRDJJ_07430 [Actinomycetota bacterium]
MSYVALRRAVAVTASVALVFSALWATPAEAQKKKIKCPAFSAGYEDAAEAETIKVTDKATEKKPVTVEFDHPPSLVAVADDYKYYNVQIFSKARQTGLYIREEFNEVSDIDLFLYDEGGEEVASSGAFNPAPIPGLTDADGNGGSGYESISGFATERCAGFSIESHAFLTPGTDVALTIWLGKPAKAEEEE